MDLSLFQRRTVKENPGGGLVRAELFRTLTSAALGLVALGCLMACLVLRLGFEGASQDPTCSPETNADLYHEALRRGILNADGGLAKPLPPRLQVVLTNRAVDHGAWALAAGLSDLVSLHTNARIELCLESEAHGPLARVAEPRTETKADKLGRWVDEHLQKSNHGAFLELATMVTSLRCPPGVPSHRVVLDLDCSTSLSASLVAEDEEDVTTEELNREIEKLVRAQLVEENHEVEAARRQNQRARLHRAQQQLKRVDWTPPPVPEPAPDQPRGRSVDACRRLSAEAERYLVLPCQGHRWVDESGVFPEIPWLLGGTGAKDSWDSSSIVVRAMGRLGLSYALRDLSDVLARGEHPRDLTRVLFDEGVLRFREEDSSNNVVDSSSSLSCAKQCPGNREFATRVAVLLPLESFPLMNSPPAVPDRWMSEEGQLLSLPDVVYYSEDRAQGFVNVERISQECDSLESGTVRALLNSKMNGLLLLHHDVEDYVTYGLLPGYARMHDASKEEQASAESSVWPAESIHSQRASTIGRVMGGCIARLQQRYGIRVMLKTFEFAGPPQICRAPGPADSPLHGRWLCDLTRPQLMQSVIEARYHETLARIPVDGFLVSVTGSWSPRAGYESLSIVHDASTFIAMSNLVDEAVRAFDPSAAMRALQTPFGTAPADALSMSASKQDSCDLHTTVMHPSSDSILTQVLESLHIMDDSAAAMDWVGLMCGFAHGPRYAVLSVPPRPFPTYDIEAPVRWSWNGFLNATSSQLRVSTPLAEGDFLVSSPLSPLLDPAQWPSALMPKKIPPPNQRADSLVQTKGVVGRVPEREGFVPGAGTLAMRHNAIAEVDAFGQTRGWSIGLAFPRFWGRGLLSARLAGAQGVLAWNAWAPGAVWPTSTALDPKRGVGSSQLRNTSRGHGEGGDMSWAGRWTPLFDPFHPTKTNNWLPVTARAVARLVSDLSWLLPLTPTDEPLRPPGAESLVNVDAVVVASARRFARASFGPCNVDAAAAALLASQDVWAALESLSGGSGEYSETRWSMYANGNEVSWNELLKHPWSLVLAATLQASQSNDKMLQAVHSLNGTCDLSDSELGAVDSLAQAALVTSLFQGTWSCMLESSWWIRSARVVSLSLGAGAVEHSMPPTDAAVTGGCLAWAWPFPLADSEPLSGPDRVCRHAGRLLSVLQHAIQVWDSQFPDLSEAWQIGRSDPRLDVRPAFWRDTEVNNPRSLRDHVQSLRWRWKSLCAIA
jgi:hypothetical protein